MAISHGFNKTEAATSVTAPVTVNSGLQIVVGTAPVNMLDDPEAAVNTPMLVNTFKEAAAAVGYSDDFAKYTLCEAVSASFQVMGISPIVVVNVLDPANAKHITELSNKTVQVNDGIAEIDETGILLKKLVVKKEQTVLTADEDYSASFNDDGTVSIALVNGGKGDGATALTISGSILDPTKITAADIVGGVNAATGAETGLEVVRQVFPKLGMVPGILLAPRFSKDPMVCAALQAKCRKINGVFDAVCFVDIDSSASGTPTWQTRRSSRAQLLVKHMACGCTARSAAPSTAAALWPLLRQSTTTACTTTRPMPARPMSAYPFPPPAWKMAPKS